MVDNQDANKENISVAERDDAVRGMIRALVKSGDLKDADFRKQLDVSASAFSAFMKRKGAAQDNEVAVSEAGMQFFKNAVTESMKSKNTKTKEKSVPKVDDVELDGEKDDDVEVYDTCDDIRRKITLHLNKPGMTQALFLRGASASFHRVPKKLSSAQLSAFRSKKGPREGNTSGIYYGAYVYFEKLRIKEGKPKSAKREEMEAIWGEDRGMNTKDLFKGVLCVGNERPSVDQYGKISFFRI